MLAKIWTSEDDIAQIKYDCINISKSDHKENLIDEYALYNQTLNQAIKIIERKHNKSLSSILDSNDGIWAIITTPKRMYKLTTINF